MSWWIFGHSAWRRLPIELRRRWWDETNYSKRPPSLSLLKDVLRTIWK